MNKRQRQVLLAKRLRAKAVKYLEWGVKTFKDDPDMLEAVRENYRDLRGASMLLREGKEYHAAKIICEHDTSVREEVPASVFNYLDKVYYGW